MGKSKTRKLALTDAFVARVEEFGERTGGTFVFDRLRSFLLGRKLTQHSCSHVLDVLVLRVQQLHEQRNCAQVSASEKMLKSTLFIFAEDVLGNATNLMTNLLLGSRARICKAPTVPSMMSSIRTPSVNAAEPFWLPID